MRTKLLAIVFAATMLQSTSDSRAQSWPQRPVTVIVSQAAGAAPDIMTRLIAARLEQVLKTGIVVENKPGGGNVIGAQAAAKANPDGHTFFLATSAALVTIPFLMKNLPYDPIQDFAPVALITVSKQVLVVTPSVPAKTLAELIALDRQAPGKLSVAVDGPRNLAGVIAQALNARAGTKFVPVSYPNITVAWQDVIAGRVEIGIFSASIAEPMIKDGKLRGIAGPAASPIPLLPDLPTVSSTLPGFDFLGWFMMLAPANTPKDIVVGMNAALQAAMNDPEILDRIGKMGFEVSATGVGSAEDAATYLKSQYATWKKTVQDLGIQPQ